MNKNPVKRVKTTKVLIYHTPFQQYGNRRVTVIGILNPKTYVIKIGLAVTRPGDLFCRKTGREVATERAKKRNAAKVNLSANVEHFGKEFVKFAQLFAGQKVAQIVSR